MTGAIPGERLIQVRRDELDQHQAAMEATRRIVEEAHAAGQDNLTRDQHVQFGQLMSTQRVCRGRIELLDVLIREAE